MKATATAAAALLMSASVAAAAGTGDCPRASNAGKVAMPPPAAMPGMAMDKPMPSAMAKPGTMPMDVTEAAGAKDDCMRPMLNKEQGMMDAKPPAKP